MTFQKRFILDKLNTLKEYLGELENLVALENKEILDDSYKLHTAERLLQLIVDTMIDINQHFIRELKLQIKDDFQSTFYSLGESGILPSEFSKKLAPIVGLRNRIVHRYEVLDKELFINTLKDNFPDLKAYIVFIKKYINLP